MSDHDRSTDLAKRMEVLPAELAEEFPLLARDVMDETIALFDANMAGQTIEVINLPKIKAPSGGMPDFLVEGAEGDTSARKLEGIYLTGRSARVYFDKPYGSGGQKRPSCTSQDAIIGVGDPGGSCRKCPFAEYGSASRPDGSKGAGQACRQQQEILFLLPGESLPHLLRVPPTSLKAHLQFLMNLTSAHVRHWGATTTLTLEPAQSEGGVKYSKIRFHLGRRFPPELVKILEPYRLKMRELLIPSIVDTSAYEVIDDEAAAAREMRETVAPPPDESEPIPF